MKFQLLPIHLVLSKPGIFKLFNSLIIGKCRSIFVEKYVRPEKGDRILDIGCGLGDILDYLPDVDYVGFDMNQRYIDAAVKYYGNRGKFLCKNVSKETIKENSSFDIVMANGVLHHLNNEEAIELFELAQLALNPIGTLITIDGCYVESQSPIVQYLLLRDRGQYVRTKERYLALASKVFTNIKVSIRHDLLRIPYTHIIMECKTGRTY